MERRAGSETTLRPAFSLKTLPASRPARCSISVGGLFICAISTLRAEAGRRRAAGHPAPSNALQVLQTATGARPNSNPARRSRSPCTMRREISGRGARRLGAAYRGLRRTLEVPQPLRAPVSQYKAARGSASFRDGDRSRIALLWAFRNHGKRPCNCSLKADIYLCDAIPLHRLVPHYAQQDHFDLAYQCSRERLPVGKFEIDRDAEAPTTATAHGRWYVPAHLRSEPRALTR